MNENIACPVAEPMSISIFGSGNSSLGHTLLRFRKSTQHHIYPFFFLTSTMLENHFGCMMGLMNPAVRSFWTSWIIWASISGWKVRMGCTTGFALGSMLRACATRLGSKPGILWYFQAKTLMYSFNSEMSWAFSNGGKVALTEVGC